MMKRVIVLAIALLSSVYSLKDSAAQSGDSIQYRTLRSILPDSTIFSYRIGEIGLLQSTGSSYLGFVAAPWTSPASDFLVTNSFIVADSSDSLSFYRVMNFDSKGVLFTDVDITTPGAQADSVIAAWETILSAKTITPDTASFASSSSVRYIVELRRASDNAVLLRLDTVTCYANGGGKLRFSTTRNTASHRIECIGSAGMGTLAYVAVRMSSVIPLGSSFTHYPYSMAEQEPTVTGNVCGEFQDNCSFTAFKPAIPINSIPLVFALKAVTISSTTYGKIQIELNSEASGHIQCEVVNVLGETSRSVLFNAHSGNSSFEIDARIPPGAYFLRLTDGINTLTKKIQIQ